MRLQNWRGGVDIGDAFGMAMSKTGGQCLTISGGACDKAVNRDRSWIRLTKSGDPLMGMA